MNSSKRHRTSLHSLFPYGKQAPRICTEFLSSPVPLNPAVITSIRQTCCSEISKSATLMRSVSNLVYPFAPGKCLFPWVSHLKICTDYKPHILWDQRRQSLPTWCMLSCAGQSHSWLDLLLFLNVLDFFFLDFTILELMSVLWFCLHSARLSKATQEGCGIPKALLPSLSSSWSCLGKNMDGTWVSWERSTPPSPRIIWDVVAGHRPAQNLGWWAILNSWDVTMGNVYTLSFWQLKRKWDPFSPDMTDFDCRSME